MGKSIHDEIAEKLAKKFGIVWRKNSQHLHFLKRIGQVKTMMFQC